ncbi:MAG TPA: hypothetical protein VIM44_07415, partial [Rariglobus sp.]
MTPFLRKLLGMNWMLVLVMYALLVFGVFMIESAARHLPGGGAHFAEMQKTWVLIGSVVYFGGAMIDYKWIRWFGLPFYAVALGLMVLAMIKGDAVY